MNMKITVFGATGRTGLPLVQQALDAGHEVVALVRNPAKMTIHHPKLTCVQGTVTDAAAVLSAISTDTDAVISVLGPVPKEPSDVMPKAADAIITAMRAQGVRRLAFMTGAGVDAPQDKPQFINHVIKFALKAMAGDVLASSIKAVEKVQNSDLEWTIVRAPMLTDQPGTGSIRVGWVGVNTGPRMSRTDAATFMLKQATDATYVQQMPMISN